MKKKLFLNIMALSLLISITPDFAAAQIAKGNLLVETGFGNISFGNSDYENKNGGIVSSTSEGKDRKSVV